ncbi:hypothetical protein F5Y12DRAFT_670350 [Xylaria sp. FL1777]|nr:hypothetical protein F5Y12DRAFT_670350 [Xylaria sp. FL1777]
MRTTSAISVAVLAAASSVYADTTSTAASSSTACAAEAILDACLDTTESYVSLCQSQDFSCLCDKYTAIMTCFGNCPNDDRRYALDSERQLYCANASAFATKTTTSATNTASTETTPTSSDAADATDSATTTLGDATRTSASSAAETSSNGAADAVGVQRGGNGLFAALAGVVAAVML